MALTLKQFVANLSKSGLFSAAEVSEFHEKLPPEKRPKDAQGLARELIRAGKLTKYQAAAVYRGKAKALVFDEYVILDKIGAGGMGQVLKAKHRKMERIVALKFLPETAGENPTRIARFHSEVRIARQVSHPNVCRVYDIGETEGLHFISMEYVDGEDLASLLRRIGRLPPDKGLDIARQLCAGLAAAHARGILHRDLKPANVMLSGEGKVKILDFGLAKAWAPEDSNADLTHSPTLTAQMTAAGVLLGTAAYMSPEQALGHQPSQSRRHVGWDRVEIRLVA